MSSQMSIKRMIAVWARGCSCADADRPWQCEKCTVGLINAISGRVGNMALAEPTHWVREGKAFLERCGYKQPPWKPENLKAIIEGLTGQVQELLELLVEAKLTTEQLEAERRG